MAVRTGIRGFTILVILYNGLDLRIDPDPYPYVM